MPTLITKLWGASIKRQLILSIALVHALLMSIFVYDLVERQRSFLIEQNSVEARALAKTLAANGMSWILARDTIGIEEVIDSQNNIHSLNYAMFLDMDGKVLGYTERSQVNRYVDDTVSRQLIGARGETTVLLETDALIDVAAPVMVDGQQVGWARVGMSRRGITESLQSVTSSGILYTLIAISVGMVFAWFMGNGLTTGLRRLSQVTHGVATGKRHMACTLSRRDELGDLCDDFNRMIAILNEREEALHKSFSLLNGLLDSVPDLIFYKDLNGVYMGCNSAAEELFGKGEDEIVGTTDYEHFPRELADFFRDKDRQMLESGRAQKNEEWVTYPDGRQVLLEMLKSPFYSADGEVIGLIGVGRDITLLREQEEKLRRSQKMDALGKLTGGIAHDYNNLLAIIIGFAELLEQKLEGEPALQKSAHNILSAGQRGASLTAKLLSFSRNKVSNIESTDINQAMRDAYQMIEKSLTASIEITMSLDEGLWQTQLDADDFDNAVLNICINAMHAMEGSGKLHIATFNKCLGEEEAKGLETTPGDYACIAFTDTGSGMSEETISQVFDPFFSTKGERGTGLGLSQVYGTVQRADGVIGIDSELGHGTTFTLYFPRFMGSQPLEATPPQLQSTETMHGKRALVVDDEEGLRELIQQILSDCGVTTLSAANGSEALATLEREKVDLLISDVIMPLMDGHQLAASARALQPGIKVLLLSGYSEQTIDKGNESSEIVRLQKPVVAAGLLAKVRQLLDGDEAC